MTYNVFGGTLNPTLLLYCSSEVLSLIEALVQQLFKLALYFIFTHADDSCRSKAFIHVCDSVPKCSNLMISCKSNLGVERSKVKDTVSQSAKTY